MAIEFNTDFYMQSKFTQLESEGLLEEFGLTDVASLEQYFEDNGVDARDHYLNAGMLEGINPSAEFDTNAYLEAKLADLQNADKYGDTYADFDIAQVIEAFQNAGLTALEHFNEFGEAEGLEATPAEGEASELTEDLAAYESAVDAQAEAEVAYSAALVEAGIIVDDTDSNDDGVADVFDPSANDYVLDAEAAVVDARQALSTERLKTDNSDADLQKAVTDAQKAVNEDKTDYLDTGAEAEAVYKKADGSFTTAATDTSGETTVDNTLVGYFDPASTTDGLDYDSDTGVVIVSETAETAFFSEGDTVEDLLSSSTYTARQLQSRAESAKAAVDAHVASNGSTFELATQLNAAIGEFITAGGASGDATLKTELDEAQAAYFTLKSEAEAHEKAGTELTSTQIKAWFDEVSDVIELDGAVVEGTALYNVKFGENTAFADDVDGAAEIKSLVGTAVDRANLEFTEALRDAAFTGEVDPAFAEQISLAIGTDVTAENTEIATAAGYKLDEAQDAWEARQELISAVTKAQENLTAVSDAEQDYNDAVAAVTAAGEELGYEIQDVDSGIYFGTDEADLFVFDLAALNDAEVTDVVINDLASDDLLFLGSDITLGTEGSADNNAQEVFITEVGGNAVLNVENTAFGSASEDYTSITLTGVAAADVSIENGAVSIVEAA